MTNQPSSTEPTSTETGQEKEEPTARITVGKGYESNTFTWFGASGEMNQREGVLREVPGEFEYSAWTPTKTSQPGHMRRVLVTDGYYVVAARWEIGYPGRWKDALHAGQSFNARIDLKDHAKTAWIEPDELTAILPPPSSIYKK